MKYCKIVFLIDTLQIGGTEHSLLEILPRFKTIEPVLCHLYPGDALRKRFEDRGVRVLSMNLPGKYSIVSAVRRIGDLIARERPALVHTNLYRADLCGRIAARMQGCPVVSSWVNECYGNNKTRAMTSGMRLKLRFTQVADCATSRLVSALIANSESTKDAQCRALHVRPEKVKVIYRGRSKADIVQMSENERIRMRLSLGCAAGDNILVSVGRLVPAKNQAQLIRAMAVVCREIPNAHLLIAGEGPLRSELTDLIRSTGVQESVRLLGSRDDIPDLLSAADFFVSSSRYEGMPGAVIEAMMAGRPMLLSDIPVHREMLRDLQFEPFFPLDDVGVLARMVIEALSRRGDAGGNGEELKSLAERRFDLESVVAQHEEFYRAVAAARESGRPYSCIAEIDDRA